jgi:hypothetical protein
MGVWITDLKYGFRKSHYLQPCAYAIIRSTHDAV